MFGKIEFGIVCEGHETIALTIKWALYAIGLHPDVQAKLYEEIERIFGKDRNRHVTESDLNDLKYLECVLKETQRLFPPVPLIGRRLLQDTNICQKFSMMEMKTIVSFILRNYTIESLDSRDKVFFPCAFYFHPYLLESDSGQDEPTE
ncbi:probable cytochrome P450 4d20 [Trichonephila inaurata madagascariensis]|uniref:Probable cytochrome P450 4d20 n=1 Tax=Trichonephila inaurata madagascariensis TaxID=2747483 RepID=A0A8X6X2L9_9ARAC|nr:probable cytochrome P450 4d20 [Trichonephila inaurata madagascariensis]